MTTDEDQVSLFEKSAAKFTNVFGNDMSKNIEKHTDWEDKSNFGVTHFGMNPKLLPFSTIALDNHHCRSSIVRSIWAFSRTCLGGYGFEMNENLVSILKTELED